jgi:uncharacterized protein YndB with AHSA1/START domain
MEPLVLSLRRILPGSRAAVYTALSDPKLLASWWGPHGFTAPNVDFTPRTGRSYRIAMQPPDADLFHLSGEFREVAPPCGLAYTFRWEPPDPDDRETLARLVLRERDGATEVELTQHPFATEARCELHRTGWIDTLARLASHLASA